MLTNIFYISWVVIAMAWVRTQSLRCEEHSCAGYIKDVLTIDGSAATITTIWIAPDDVFISRVPNRNAISCPTSNLRAVVNRALKLTLRQVTLRPFCLEGLVLLKTPLSVLIDTEEPTYCALLFSSTDKLQVRDITFDNGECINTTRSTTSSPIADYHAAIILRPRSSRLDSDTRMLNLTFATRAPSVAVLLSPPTWDKTLELNDPSFTGFRGSTEKTHFVALLVTGLMTLSDFHKVEAILLPDPIVGASQSQAIISTINLWRYLDARVLMRLRQVSYEQDPTASPCSSTQCSDAYSTTLIAIAFSLVALLTICIIVLLAHSCRSVEAQDLAPYRIQNHHAEPTS